MLEIDELVKMSKYAGMREDLVQAGGGNTSVKINDKIMYIKSSGYHLSEVERKTGYSKVNYKKIVEFFKNYNEDEITQEKEKKILEEILIEGNRPSIETFLHSITDKYTLHTHPVLVNIFTSRKNGMKILKEIFPNSIVITYKTPGIFLAKELFNEIIKYKDKKREIIFLKNHGLIISGENVEKVIEKNEKVLNILEKKLEVDMKAYKTSTHIYLKLNEILDNNIVYLCENQRIKSYLKKNKFQELKYWFSPDSLIYCGKRLLKLNNEEDLLKRAKTHINKYGKFNIIYYEENFYIVASNVKKAKEIESVLAFNLQILDENKNEKIELLSEREQNFLLNWDSEKYRKNM
ncbi:class II aldolase [Leptotrichia sp. OH3620_COT-345]|uniref:class II aldolase/adducin family protein n=1 Tax=Leptotrichia sp. OH3620_COT-345 TaxID=2491048 RepID=UPI000F645ABF|nr:class II aldolase/adducin family protein [Leptotrichia sp. OH3620_COT-345]RRD40757.1 class II aldolase [Leptotrichia sp. OH3620_COT-345]